ncbi:MAG: hypothetical protein IBX69_14805 [Anaerolineales bacterium]|nr:hypothetical protein [Anaerolineales bacterium]
MDQYYSDTHANMEALQMRLLRGAPPWRKMELLVSLVNSSRSLAMAGMRERYPNASEAELRRQFAELMLGTDLAQQIYEEEQLDAI